MVSVSSSSATPMLNKDELKNGTKSANTIPIQDLTLKDNSKNVTHAKNTSTARGRMAKQPINNRKQQNQQKSSTMSNVNKKQQDVVENNTNTNNSNKKMNRQSYSSSNVNHRKSREASQNKVTSDQHQQQNQQQSAPRSDPLISNSFILTASDVEVGLELIKNSKNELFLIIRTTQLQNPEDTSRVAFPFEKIDEALQALEQGLEHLVSKTVDGILATLSSENAQVANMYTMSYGYSNYFIDFKLVTPNDVVLRITERKKFFNTRNSRSYELIFDKNDTKQLHQNLLHFVNMANTHIGSEDFQETLPSLVRCDHYTMEWITRNNMSMFLKLYLPSTRILFPMAMCRPVQSILHRIGDLYQQYGTDYEKYFEVMRDEREKLNSKRQEKGLEKLADLVMRQPAAMMMDQNLNDDDVDLIDANNNNNNNNNNQAYQHQQRVPRYQTLYSTRINSMEHRKFYHFDIVLQNESQNNSNNLEEVKMRIVEIQKLPPNSNNSQNQNNPAYNSKTNTLKHQLFVPMSLFARFCEAFDKIIERIPLPPEEAFFMNNTRCFVKFNVKRGKGLILKIKTQQALSPNAIAAAQQNSHEGQLNQNRFGNTEIIELPVMLVYRIYKYLATNCPFVLPDQQQ